MDILLIVIGGLSMLAGVASAIVAITNAVKASESEKRSLKAQEASEAARDESAVLAKKATAAFIRQAEALEERNELKRRELTPANWTGPTHVNGDTYKVVNTSGRTILVDRFEVEPDEASRNMRISSDTGNRFEYGESFEMMHARRHPVRANRLIVFWRFEDEPDSDLSRYIISP